MLIKTGTHYAWVCDSNPKVTGRFDFDFYLKLHLSSGIDNIAHVTNYVIAEESRDKGHGTTMMLELIEEARNLGMVAITLDVARGNDRAMHVYKKCGFVIPTDHYSNGEHGDRWRMMLKLRG